MIWKIWKTGVYVYMKNTIDGQYITGSGKSFEFRKDTDISTNYGVYRFNTVDPIFRFEESNALNELGVSYTALALKEFIDLNTGFNTAGGGSSAADLTDILSKGGYIGTAKDLENAITAAVTGASGISIVPTSPAPSGTGIASFTATQAGTYTNYGGVVVAANSFAIISRSSAGAFSISQTPFNIPTGKILTWSAGAYAIGDQVNHLGRDWTAAVATVAGDIPATSFKWVERLNGYASITQSNNYFSFLNANSGQYINAQFIQSGGSKYVTDFLPIDGGDLLSFYKNISPISLKFITYDERKVAVVWGTANSLTTAANAKFIRIETSLADSTFLQITKGANTPTSYVKPIFTFDKKDLKDIVFNVENLSESVVKTVEYDVNKVLLLLTANIFVLNNAKYGQYINGTAGNFVIQGAGSSWYVSDFIAISETEQISFYNNITLKSCKYIIYDALQAKIGDGESSSFVAPTNAKFVKVDTGVVSDFNLFMILKGTTAPTVFTKATYSLSNKNGRKLSVDLTDLSEPVITPTFLDTIKVNSKQVGFLVDSVNLVDSLAVKIGITLNATGAEVGTPGWITTDFLPVTDNVKNYSFTGGVVRTYDANKVFNNLTITSGQPIPSTIKFIRWFTGNNTIFTFQQVYDLNLFFGIADTVPSPRPRFAKTFDPIKIDVIDSQRILSFPNTGKKVFCVGDSFTMQGLYFNKLTETAFLTKVGDSGGAGNGQTLTTFASAITNTYPTLLETADIVTILGGTNDYGHGSTTLGSFADVAGANTIYGAVKGIVNAIYAIKPSAKIVFFSQPERGTYDSKPINTVPPAVNVNGLNMYNISEAIYDCCSRLGIACGQTHHTLWHFSQVNLYTVDNLHPNALGADMLGKQMGSFINKI